MNRAIQIPTIFLILMIPSMAFGDEGMWTLNGFPAAKVKKKYGFSATKEWLDHVRLSSARLAGGCSGSFVSGNGLVITNHHCAHSCIEQLSRPGQDFIASGFFAKTDADEVRCPEIEVNRLVEIRDVTDQIGKATSGLKGHAYNDAQKGAMSRIEKDCSAGSDEIRCDVVTLYHGGQYHLYKYQRFQDVRLVFAPEFAIAFFGGDPDNFMFPRYDLDMSFLRVYSGGKPLQTNDYFHWSTDPAKDRDLTFVTGHPGHTSRLLSISELEFQRDTSLIRSMLYLSELRGFLTEYQNRGVEQKRTSGPMLFRVENSLKALKGKHQALLDKKFFAAKIATENALRKKVNEDPRLKKEYGSAWDEIGSAIQAFREFYPRYIYIEAAWGMNSRLLGIARTLVRGSSELAKPNEQRLREFADSRLPALKQDLFSTAPIHDELETAMITFSLTKLREALTADDPFVKKVFGVRSPSEIAAELAAGTKLRNVDARKALFDGGRKAIEESKDPMIQFARLLEPDSFEVRKKYEDEIEPVLKKGGEKVAKAFFAIHGTDTYPDATFTLRISYGRIQGYRENGHEIVPITRIKGAFDRDTGRDPFALPASWTRAKPKLNLETPLDFCSTNDIIGGNSGSPVINKDAQIVGLIFDGNIQSLGGDYGFDESVNRAVAVHSAGIIEALGKIYGAQRIVRELLGKSQGP